MEYYISKLKASYVNFHEYTYMQGEATGRYWAIKLASSYELRSMAEYFSDVEKVDDFLADTGVDALPMANLLPYIIADGIYGDECEEIFWDRAQAFSGYKYEHLDNGFVIGFIKGATDIYEDVRPRLVA